MSTLLGLDLGASAMKLAVGDQSGVSQIASVLLPSDLIRDRKMVSEERWPRRSKTRCGSST